MAKESFSILNLKMNEVIHWWNITKCLSKFDGKGANSYRMYFVERCRRMSQELELPKKIFGPSVMCSHCGSLWSKNESQTRIKPANACSKSVKQIIRSSAEDNRLSRFRATLLKKSLKNRMNKVVKKCSVCSKDTEISITKPKRPKLVEESTEKNDNTAHHKKKKKKVKDKSAGLDLSGFNTPDAREKKKIPLVSTPITVKVKKPYKREITPLQKVKKLNINKLNNILNNSKAKKSKSSLSNFLEELY
ncbi:uncharacterized protein LOC131670404 [Phymastichus coffea]|uniref:uncharacterized protein LOC131670404 n=1 Tax=Phymastichus coffea TaxID=108790 RepID=UPI00273BB23A|nr:uncharacterized protein LOC131670404 [Phymastichus coffea]